MQDVIFTVNVHGILKYIFANFREDSRNIDVGYMFAIFRENFRKMRYIQ